MSTRTGHVRGPGGHILSYEERGAGDAVLFLHGFPHDRELWSPQLAGLAPHARCIAIDQRGFGASGTSGPYSMDRYAEDAVGLLDELEIERATIAGLSMGGYVAFAIWRQYPERVRAMVLADTKAGADDDAARSKRREMMELASQRGTEAVAERMIEGMIGKSTRASSPDVVAFVRRILERQPVPGVIGALEAMMSRPDSTALLADISVPTLIVVGDEDVLTPPAEARAMHERIPGCELVELAGAGHVSNVERADEFNEALRRFLARLT